MHYIPQGYSIGMALIITVKQGGDFFLNREKYVVDKILSPHAFVVRGEEDVYYHISADRAMEVDKEVYISAGTNQHWKSVKLVIAAPMSIKILRGDNFRKAYGISGVQTH